jgi:L-threonylcarbamoyladenylate synthase
VSSARDFDLVLEHLSCGGVLAAATESWFGLLADIRDPRSMAAVFSLKPRGSDKGVPVILPNRAAWAELVAGPIPELASAFADAFWPGPLSIALPVSETVVPGVSLAGSLAVRLPGDSAAAEIALRFGKPLSATSANLPGDPPLRLASEVERIFADALDRGVLQVLSGISPGGAPSTVVEVDGESYRVLRAGAVPSEQLAMISARLTRRSTGAS